MKQLTTEQVYLLKEVMAGKQPLHALLEKMDNEINVEFCLNLLLDAKVIGDTAIFRDVLWAFGFVLNAVDALLLHRMALIDDWHEAHEGIVGKFQMIYNQDAANIPYLKKVMQQVPDYLQDEALKDAFIRKYAYAIAAQPAPYNEEAPRELSQSDDEVIKKYALHQLVKNDFYA